MTIVTACRNSVVYILANNGHTAFIILKPSVTDVDLYPYEAHIFYDDEPGEIIQAQNGQTMRIAMRFVRDWARNLT